MRAFRAAAAQRDGWWGRFFFCGLSCATATSSPAFNFTSSVSTAARGIVVGLGVVDRVRCGCSSTGLRHSLVVGKVDQDRAPLTSAHETTPLIYHPTKQNSHVLHHDHARLRVKVGTATLRSLSSLLAIMFKPWVPRFGTMPTPVHQLDVRISSSERHGQHGNVQERPTD
jgi:hypothetical protein